MKSTIILLVMIFVQVSIGYSQKITMSKHNATLEEILIDINKQTGYYYSSSFGALQSAKCVTIDVKNAELQEVLTICFKDQALVYSIKGNIILIKKMNRRDRIIDENESSKKTLFIPGRKIFITECKLV